MTNTIEATACRIYVADLAAYNSGRLCGQWIDLDGKEESEVWNEINAMLAKSPEPNVVRRKCGDCEHHQDDRGADDVCNHCGGELSAPFPSAEEWAVHDHDGFGGLISGEWPDIGELCTYAAFMAESDYETIKGLHYLVDDCGRDVADAMERAADVRLYEGEADDYAAELVEDCYSDVLEALPGFLRYHIDYEGVARDLELGGDIAKTTIDGKRYIVTNASEF